tara:strand:- start:156 stop:494 length:339 start_codon:yes stop_codon:yes gene_type:complete
MIWPPVKAWTSKVYINGFVHFVAISYGGESIGKWVILMAVIDSSVVVKVLWSQLVDSSKWKAGWDEIKNEESYEEFHSEGDNKNIEFTYPSHDSGLTIPISKNRIRPWFAKK